MNQTILTIFFVDWDMQKVVRKTLFIQISLIRETLAEKRKTFSLTVNK